MTWVFVDPPSPPGRVSFKHGHGGYGELCHSSRLKTPTLDLFHAATLLLERGISAALVDSVLLDHSPEDCADAILALKPETVVFRTASASCPRDLAVAELLRGRFGGRILFYGPQVSAEPERVLDSPAVDAVVLGEAPLPLLRVAETGSFAGVPGLRYKSRGRVVKNRPAPWIDDLDILPIPRWDLAPYRRYSYVVSQTSWGCPLGCGYCPYPVTQGKLWRTRSSAGVVAEFRALRERYRIPFVLLRDPQFIVDRRRTLALCRELARAGSPVLWGCETRLESLDEELVAAMAEAGCIRVEFGVESVNAEALARQGRRALAQDAIRRKTALLKRHGMLTYALYMIGLPGETAESTRAMIDFALELGTNAASFSMATPFPGTSLARERAFVTAGDPLHLTASEPSMRNAAMSSEEIFDFYREAKSRWKQRSTRPLPGVPSLSAGRR